jgi:hypothetical protein
MPTPSLAPGSPEPRRFTQQPDMGIVGEDTRSPSPSQLWVFSAAVPNPISKLCYLGRIWGSHSGGYEEYRLLGYNAVWSKERQPTFRRNISPPSSGSKDKTCKKPAWKQLTSRVTCFLAWLIFRLWRRRRYVPPKRRLTHQTTWRYSPEDGTLHTLCYAGSRK